MLYDYLNALGGLCASHTSATGMGTDWRDNDPKVEPIVEIFQGHRQSYEHLGAPRVARRPGESIGGWRPMGMVWNALSMQYRLGFQASSDHISTHISFAVALAEDRSRASIFEAFQKRHCYGATDNIVLDVRSGEHIMGDEFAADGPGPAQGHGPRDRADRAGGRHQGFRLRLLDRAQDGPGRVRVARRGEARPRPELVLRPRPPGGRRDRLGEPDLGPDRPGSRSGWRRKSARSGKSGIAGAVGVHDTGRRPTSGGLAAMAMANGRPAGPCGTSRCWPTAGAIGGLTDEQLLGRFVAARDEAAELAFAALVDGHGPMVRGVCRRVLRDPADAGDAFQATFLVLARGPARSGWAGRSPPGSTASASGSPAGPGPSPPAGTAASGPTPGRSRRRPATTGTPTTDLRAAIDEELRRLPGRYGSALVLFYLEGLSHEEAAGRLGCPVGTVRSRLSRGRDLLRDRLARRGLAPSSASMLAAIAPRSPLPESILGLDGPAAARLAAGRAPGGTVPPGVASLVAGVSRMMTLQKLAPVAALSAACVLAALGLASASRRDRSARTPGPEGRRRPEDAGRARAQARLAKPEPVETPGAEAGIDPGPFVDYPAFVVKTEPPTGADRRRPRPRRDPRHLQQGDEGRELVVGRPSARTPPPRSPARSATRRTGGPASPRSSSSRTSSTRSRSTRRSSPTSATPEAGPAVPYMLVFKTRKSTPDHSGTPNRATCPRWSEARLVNSSDRSPGRSRRTQTWSMS